MIHFFFIHEDYFITKLTRQMLPQLFLEETKPNVLRPVHERILVGSSVHNSQCEQCFLHIMRQKAKLWWWIDKFNFNAVERALFSVTDQQLMLDFF